MNNINILFYSKHFNTSYQIIFLFSSICLCFYIYVLSFFFYFDFISFILHKRNNYINFCLLKKYFDYIYNFFPVEHNLDGKKIR